MTSLQVGWFLADLFANGLLPFYNGNGPTTYCYFLHYASDSISPSLFVSLYVQEGAGNQELRRQGVQTILLDLTDPQQVLRVENEVTTRFGAQGIFVSCKGQSLSFWKDFFFFHLNCLNYFITNTFSILALP